MTPLASLYHFALVSVLALTFASRSAATDWDAIFGCTAGFTGE
jgi:hypothetical protein